MAKGQRCIYGNTHPWFITTTHLGRITTINAVRCKIVLGLTFLELSCKVDRHGKINLRGTEIQKI